MAEDKLVPHNLMENESFSSTNTTATNNTKITTASTIPNHIEKIQTEDGRQHYKCTICGKVFSSRTQQYYHIGCANEASKKYKCDKCEKCFATRSHLKYHLESHSMEIYNCSQCQKSFTNQAVLKKHEKLHQTVPLNCSECDKIFRSKESLSAHMEQHRNNLRYHCNTCDSKYAAKSTLQQHMLKHMEKKYQCNQCSKRFQRNSTLKLHQRRHSKTDSFVCAKCSHCFNDAGTLLRHSKLHEATKKYKCIHCDITTIRKDNMLRHVRNMHIGEDFQKCVEIITVGVETAHIPIENKPIEELNVSKEIQLKNSIDGDDDGDSDAINLPKTIENSSVIKCIGNVEPVKIPHSKFSFISMTNEEKNMETLTVLENAAESKTTGNEKKSITLKKSIKKKYDPIEMYRKILISNDDDDDDHHVDEEQDAEENINCLQIINDNHLNEDKKQQHYNVSEKPMAVAEVQRNTLNIQSNFSEMHWRKNYKYTYQYQEY